ncbi:PREDICTED: uncharacterized protein LOC103327135 [Prunus mume]|uniref:Uncharacterized protein LOC103327135 n=1 Tax=Prunus mume TaxID=102107 RepID=A0ABM0NP01_PRUMU|nr:PREDICTED: uncharacterized protein LOC103327135 [Prunus mume]
MGDFSIQISSNLVDKLVHDAEKSKRKPRRTKIKVPREPQQPQTKTNQKQVSDDSETLKGTGAKGWPLQPPIFVPVTPPSQSTYAELDAIRSVLQESSKVLERLQKQEENMVQEVTQRAKELRDKEFKLPFQKPMPCLTEKDACLACYKEHANNPLKCAGFVKSFEDCARRIRQQVDILRNRVSLKLDYGKEENSSQVSLIVALVAGQVFDEMSEKAMKIVRETGIKKG